MGRWLAALASRSGEKNQEPAKARTDETDKTGPKRVSSVLSVPNLSVFENSAGPDDFEAAIEECAALCADWVPAPYLDKWARLNYQKPSRVSDAQWRRALDDGGRFFDAWGSLAAEWGWNIAELFDVPSHSQFGGLFWFIEGATVEAFGPDHARLSDDRIFDRGTIGGERC